MARPVKWRKIEVVPAIKCFAPIDSSESYLADNILKIEELEALRLKDLECLEQVDCAAKMEVSRPTFQRILQSARSKVADSLINGKGLRIEGGNFTRNICPLKCVDCGKEWSESYEKMESVRSGGYSCPQCHSMNVACCRRGRGKGRCPKCHCGEHSEN